MCHLHSLPLHISNLTTASSSMNVTPTVISRKCQKFHSSPSHIMYNINYHFQIYVMLKEMHFGFAGNNYSQYVLIYILAYTMFNISTKIWINTHILCPQKLFFWRSCQKKKIVGEEDMEKKKYDEGVGCGSTNQQL